MPRRPRRLFVFFTLLIVACLSARAAPPAGDPGIPATTSLLRFQLVSAPDRPIIDSSHPDAAGNHYGFEGGSVVKSGDTWHLFVSEMYGEPKSVAMRLGHWISHDERIWTRVATVATRNGPYETDGRDHGPRSSFWAPMPIYDLKDDRWDLFYVAYQSERGGAEGRIWRAVSTVAGPNGIGGPYEDKGIILQRGPDHPAWEGYQGTDSFYPYRVGDRWYGFYGSHGDDPLWPVGLVTAPHLDGPWARLPDPTNPLPIEPTFIENPIVARVGNLYVAVYDSDTYSPSGAPTGGYSYSEPRFVGYSYSTDGIHWSRGGRIAVQQPGIAEWASDIRTPLCLLPESDGTFTIFYTAQMKGREYWAVGSARVRIIGLP